MIHLLKPYFMLVSVILYSELFLHLNWVCCNFDFVKLVLFGEMNK